MLLTASIYMQIPVLPGWLMDEWGLTSQQVACVMGSYGVGLFLLGPFCGWLVQRYRRNHVFLWAALGLVATMLLALFHARHMFPPTDSLFPWLLLRMLMGCTFGLSQMVLSSTLIIDTCESFQRTEANHSSAWFSRFALSLGPMAGLVVVKVAGVDSVLWASLGLVVASIVLVQCIRFPFKAPDDTVPRVSSDRFFLLQGKWLFLNLLLVTTIIGLLMSIPQSAVFYAVMMAGFLLALLSEKYVFADADLKSEVLTGLMLIGTALLLLLTRKQVVVDHIAPLFVGFGCGIIGSRFLLFFIKLSKHCQRGTSQSTFFLAWECGLTLGVAVGYAAFSQHVHALLILGLALTAGSLVLYNYWTHPWYMRHRNR